MLGQAKWTFMQFAVFNTLGSWPPCGEAAI